MQVYKGIEELPPFSNSVITIGTFDGVHQGHRKLIKTLVDEAGKVNGESVIITFDPHPRKIINPAEPLQLINTLKEKIELLSTTGVDHLVVVPFTKKFSELPAEEYISHFLVAKFHPHTIIIGYDHHFGRNRQGNIAFLQERGSHYGYELLQISKHTVDEIAISSTRIRDAILSSDIETANKLLGYEYFFEGVVINGSKLGRELGFPTANIEYTNPYKIRLGDGVYAVYVTIDTVQKKGMLSIGNRPTLKDSAMQVEVNIFDFDENIYGKELKISVKKFLRPQEKYADLEELTKQLYLDKENSLQAL
jgi:riboflavin kinase / FMN adenylyltransferase